jgi:glycosyltransferase involved in cell wall biosynthesis
VSKKRILWVGEASPLSSGYANYSLEVLKRLHASGKYEVCELGSYLPYGDERAAELPWRFVFVSPDPSNQAEVDAYNADHQNQWGKWKFEPACLAFRATHVLDVRDAWYMDYEAHSPLRPFYRLAWMPACDAEPQKKEWVADYLRCDALFTYSDWAVDVLRRQGGPALPLRGSAPPGADYESFRIIPGKDAHKARFGLGPDSLVVGFVARNQVRKLFPSLLRAFSLYLENAPEKIRGRTYLHLHTAWPDVGWDVPSLLKEHAVGSRVLFTYHCRACGQVGVHHWMDARGYCRWCGSHAAVFPNTNLGASRAQMCDIINLWDAYTQFANSEGSGIPQIEAAACGVVSLSVDYSAMGDVVRKLGGYPVKVLSLQKEVGTECMRAVPDEADWAAKLSTLLSLPGPVRRSMGGAARANATRHYDWDKTAAAWMEFVDSTSPARSWDEPASLHTPAPDPPAGVSLAELVDYGYAFVAGRPDLLNTLGAMAALRDLGWGQRFVGTKPEPYGRDEFLAEARRMAEHRNAWERRRCGL